jgi:peptidyl-prolyl cis-trans isomerase B (cyclophilin B)
MPNRLLASLAVLVALGLTAGCGGDDDTAKDEPSGSSESSEPTTSDSASREATDVTCTYTEDGAPPAKEVELPPEQAVVSGQLTATMETSAGTFTLTLDADKTPCTVNSFVSLADQGYFDGTSCHRMTTGKGFEVLQCGDPTGTGSGGPGYSFEDELTGDETYTAGTLAMANAGPNTNGSQFFIVYGDTRLNPAYTVFGTVDDATISAIEEVAKGGTDNASGPGDGHPLTPVDIESVKVE